jgi:hypothetical protein
MLTKVTPGLRQTTDSIWCGTLHKNHLGLFNKRRTGLKFEFGKSEDYRGWSVFVVTDEDIFGREL